MRIGPFLLTRRVLFAAISSTSLTFTSAMSLSKPKIIDSHLHVWASSDEVVTKFPYFQDPPENLKDRASTLNLLQEMEAAGVDGALIVQPINHKFDHSYVSHAIQKYPERFKGMILFDPNMGEAEAFSQLEDLKKKGFVGVRFNPYLWPKLDENKWSPMSEGVGLDVYKKCGALDMPVGIMCFQGLDLHYDDIVALLTASPDTTLILDHFGFTAIDNDASFDQLLSLARYPNVYVKISALFRLNDTSPFEEVRRKRFLPLLSAFGANRLMYGSDFPFVLEQPNGYRIVDLVSSWIQGENERNAIMGGTAEDLFGPWGA